MDLEIIDFATSSSQLKQIFDLRYEVLRKPWQQTYSTASDDLEEESFNAFISINNKVIACGRLQINSETIGQIRYMATDENYRGKNYGKRILMHLEQKAIELNLKTIDLQARENAVNFYLQNNYQVIEKSFLLWDKIQHYLMRKKL